MIEFFKITYDFILDILTIFKSKAYNKITMIIVFGAIGFMSEPLFVTIYKLIKKDDTDDTSDIYLLGAGIILIFFALAYNVYMTKNDKKDTNNRDNELFNEFMLKLPSYSYSINFLNSHNFYNKFAYENINHLMNYLDEQSNNLEACYNDKYMERLRVKFLKDLDIFLEYCADNSRDVDKECKFYTVFDIGENKNNLSDRTKETIKKLSKLSSNTIKSYKKLYKIGKEKCL